jgi:hypothetical protein
MGGRLRLGVVGVAGLTVGALVVVAVGMVTGRHDSVSAKPLPRGGLVAVPERSAVLNGPAVLKAFGGVRGVVKAPPLTRSGCLDTAATSLASSFNSGTVATTASTGCGRVDWGWVAGNDPTGAQQAKAAYGRTATGPSPLLGKTVRYLGLAVGPRRESGVLTGFVLVWVVSA